MAETSNRPTDEEKRSRDTRWMLAAARRGDLGRVEKLFERCDPSERDEHGNTALMHAARNGHAGLFEYLVDRCDVDAKSPSGQTALMIAASWNRNAMVDALLEKCDATIQDEGGWDALIWSITNRQGDMAKKLIPHVNLLARDQAGGYGPREHLESWLRRDKSEAPLIAELKGMVEAETCKRAIASMAREAGNAKAILGQETTRRL